MHTNEVFLYYLYYIAALINELQYTDICKPRYLRKLTQNSINIEKRKNLFVVY